MTLLSCTSAKHSFSTGAMRCVCGQTEPKHPDKCMFCGELYNACSCCDDERRAVSDAVSARDCEHAEELECFAEQIRYVANSAHVNKRGCTELHRLANKMVYGT